VRYQQGVSIAEPRVPPWRLVSNHGLVLLALADRPSARLRDLAATSGVTERACQSIVNDLCREGYVSRQRVGRCNMYRVNRLMPMRHPALRGHEVATLLELLGPGFSPDWSTQTADTVA